MAGRRRDNGFALNNLIRAYKRGKYSNINVKSVNITQVSFFIHFPVTVSTK